jgi:hypothetical protein
MSVIMEAIVRSAAAACRLAASAYLCTALPEPGLPIAVLSIGAISP